MVWPRPSAVSLALGIRVDQSDQAETCNEANLLHVSHPPSLRLAQPNKQAVASEDLSSGSTWSNRPLRLNSCPQLRAGVCNHASSAASNPMGQAAPRLVRTT